MWSALLSSVMAIGVAAFNLFDSNKKKSNKKVECDDKFHFLHNEFKYIKEIDK